MDKILNKIFRLMFVPMQKNMIYDEPDIQIAHVVILKEQNIRKRKY